MATKLDKVSTEALPIFRIARLTSPIRDFAACIIRKKRLGAGQRFSAIVVGGEPGEHAFKSVVFKFDEKQPPLPQVELGTVVSQGPQSDMATAEKKVEALQVSERLYADVVRSSPITRRIRLDSW